MQVIDADESEERALRGLPSHLICQSFGGVQRR